MNEYVIKENAGHRNKADWILTSASEAGCGGKKKQTLNRNDVALWGSVRSMSETKGLKLHVRKVQTVETVAAVDCK